LTVITLTKDELIGKITALIHFSIRSGAAVIGQNRLESFKTDEIGLVLMSYDTSVNTVENISARFDKDKTVRLNYEVQLGKLIGKEGVKVIGFKKSGLQKEIVKLIKSCEGI